MNKCRFCNKTASHYLHVMKNGKKLSASLAQVCEQHTALDLEESEILVNELMSSNEKWFSDVKSLRYVALTESQERKINILKGKI